MSSHWKEHDDILCANKLPAHLPIVFDDSGYIFGMKFSVDVSERDGYFCAIYTRYNGTVKKIKFRSDSIWKVAERYYNEGGFHGEAGSECADCGRFLVRYRGKVAEPETVPELMAYTNKWFGKLG